MTNTKHPSPWLFVLFPAMAMLLGWGLRGYIGGGPFGALIPGVFVALCLCLLLGYTKQAAAMAALFGAIGVGYGGDMTYGQTLGFLRDPDTVWWGLLGCVVKGGIWGLLGGAVLGVGLTRYRFDNKSIVFAFLLSILAFFIGIKLINDPRLLYFSDPVNKPRDESWAGLLFAAMTILGFLRYRAGREATAVMFSFARWGWLGGALGFGGGALWMVFGPSIPIEQKWIGWWKMMEFSFGFIFGAALGWAAWRNRESLQEDAVQTETPGEKLWPLVLFVLFIALIFLSELAVEVGLPEDWTPDTLNEVFLANLMQLGFSFIFVGGVAILLGMRSLHAAWQVAVTLTFFHTVFDYVIDLDDTSRFGYSLPPAAQLTVLHLATLAMAIAVYFLYRGKDPIRRLFLLVMWACYAVACVRSFGYAEFLLPPAGESFASMLLGKHPSLLFVHGTFTVSAIVTTVIVLSCFRTNANRRV